MVSGNFTKYLRQRGLKNELCPDGRWGKGPGRLVVRYRDAVRLQLQFAYYDPECPTSLLEVMELQLDKFEAAEENLGMMAFDRAMDKPSARAGQSIWQGR